MRSTIIGVIFAAFCSAAAAQTPPPAQPPSEIVFLQKALVALQTQRNNALDAQAVAEAKLAQAQDEITKLKAEIEELKKAKPDAK